jgi:glucose/arabinose dehydrogenase
MASEGADTIEGGRGGETLAGAGGDDLIRGGGGDDVLYGHGRADRDANSGAISVERIASGFSGSLYAVSPPGRPDELFVVEKGTGKVLILNPDTGVVNATPFLDIPDDQFQRAGEQGLLSIAFHPDYAENGRFFVFVSNANGDNEVREYRRSAADPDVADAAMVQLVLRIPHPTFDNHNGGWMSFGPDGLLYIATGDGGGGGDTDNSAQNPNELSGKVLRLDVDGDDFAFDPERNYAIPEDNPFADGPGADEVWALGLRNPWRNSFDRLTGDLWIADVGQGRQEEVNFVPAGSPGGLNFGWHVREGELVYDDDTPGNPAPDSSELVDPVAAYDHDENGGESITGGYVYRGPGGLQGHYLFADFITDRLWTVRVENGAVVDYTQRTAQLQVSGGVFDRVASFAEDGSGRLYAIGLDGEIFRITPSVGAADGADVISAGAGADRAFGGAGEDTLLGGSGADTLQGGLGDDDLRGWADDDVLRGDDGADILIGAAGANLLVGGAGADRFAFDSFSLDEARDAIRDFETGVDVIDLGAVYSGELTFIGAATFSGVAGQLRVVPRADRTFVSADVDGDRAADLLIVLLNGADPTADDFLL